MTYDKFEIKGNCRGCGMATEWHINGDYPLCRDCMVSLIYDAATIDNGAIEEAVKSYGVEDCK